MDIIKLYKIIIFLLLGSLIFFLASCDKKPEIITQEIKIGNIESINVKAFGEFNVEYGTESKLIFKGNKNLFDKLNIEVVDGELIVDAKSLINKNYGSVEFFVTMPKIKRLEVDGTAIVVLNDFLQQTEDLDIEIQGQGDIKINNFEKVKNLNINVSGTATIDALSDFENLNNLNINISGSAEYNGYLLKTNNCNVFLSGDGNCKVYVNKLLELNIKGNGEVYYKGKPEIHSTIDGTGFVLSQN